MTRASAAFVACVGSPPYNGTMALLSPTPRDVMLDSRGRPYFLWDTDLTIDAFTSALASDDADVRAYFTAKLMRQAKPDDVFEFLTPADILSQWPQVAPLLGKTQPFWSWIFDEWKRLGETGPPLTQPEPVQVHESTILIATRHEILVDKLCALLGRMELRDLRDVAALLDAGTDLDKALADAPRKDTGFSPLNLAWSLKSMRVHRLSRALGLEPHEAEEMDEFRRELIDRLLLGASPDA